MNRKSWFLLACLLFFAFFWRWQTLDRPSFDSGTKIKVISTLREEPKIVGQSQRFTLSGIEIKTWRYPEFHYGDRLEALGLVKDGDLLEYPEISLTPEAQEKDWRFWLLSLRRRIEGIFRRVLPEPQASLLSGIVLGSKAGMPGEFYQSLRDSGTLHIVVASGMNVTIIAATLIDFFILFFSRRLAIGFAFVGIWFYVLLAGAEAPVLRAGVMGTLAFLAQGLGREADAWRGLTLAAALMLFLNPLSLFDLGFQLSFVSTGGILFFGPKISRILVKVPKQLATDFSQTLGAQMATFPLIFITFGDYSPFSLPANLAIVFMIPWIMRLGGIAAILGLIFLPLGYLFGWLVFIPLTYFVNVVSFFSR